MTHLTDPDYEDLIVTAVKDGGMCFDNGFWTGIPEGADVRVGSKVRRWPKNGGFARGWLIDGVLAYYRTKEEDRRHRDEQSYGKDAAEWLSRWDAGKTVWSISMGGIGPGYEQAIQVLAVECVRHWLATNTVWWEGSEEEQNTKWKAARQGCDAVVSKLDEVYGYSGAQVGVAIDLAGHIYRKGPCAVMNDDQVTDRHIQVSRNFPVYRHDQDPDRDTLRERVRLHGLAGELMGTLQAIEATSPHADVRENATKRLAELRKEFDTAQP